MSEKNDRVELSVGTENQNRRREWVIKQLSEIPPGHRILDAGAGELKYKPYCSHLEYVSQDFGRYTGSGDNKGLQMGTWDQSGIDICSDILDIPEPDGSFDAILCIEVFEHLPEPSPAVGEFSRLLKEGGVLILTAPFCSLTHFAPYHFHTGFNRYFYEKHLPGYGFEILEIEANGNFFEYVAQELRRVKSTARKYCDTDLETGDLETINRVLPLLQELSGKDTASSELLCFGYHVKAIKKQREK